MPHPYRHLAVLEENLLLFTLAVTGVGLLFPRLGMFLEPYVALLLGILIFLVCLTFDARAVRRVFEGSTRKIGLLVLATLLVYGPMSLAGWGLGQLIFGTPLFESDALRLGQTLVGTLPTDVSAPLLVLLGRGNVALAAVMNAINTALAPVLVPGLFLLYTGEAIDLPIVPLFLELCAAILLPMAIGICLRTRFPQQVCRHDPLYSFGGSLLYLLLLLAVIGVNAGLLWGYGLGILVILGAQLLLNVLGYGVAGLFGRGKYDRADRIALLFTVSKKEFSIAAVVVFRSGLPPEVAVPAAIYAVLQMITSPVVVGLLNRRQARRRRAHKSP